MQNWKLGELVWQEIGIIPRRSPFPSAAAQANTRSRQLILTGIHELPEISEFERKERKKGYWHFQGVWGEGRGDPKNMRLQTSNCRYKNAITVHTHSRRWQHASVARLDRSNSRAHLPPNVTLKFTHFVTEKNARLDSGGQGGRGTLSTEFQGRRD